MCSTSSPIRTPFLKNTLTPLASNANTGSASSDAEVWTGAPSTLSVTVSEASSVAAARRACPDTNCPSATFSRSGDESAPSTGRCTTSVDDRERPSEAVTW